MRFFSTAARSGRMRLAAWLVAVVLAGGGGILVIRDGPPVAVLAVGGAWGLLVAKLIVEVARRRHDAGRDARGILIALTAAVVALVAGVWMALLMGLPILLYAALLLLPLLAAITLLPAGEAASNRWGPPLPSPFQPTFGEGSGWVDATLAVTLTLLGAASGYAGMRWSQGLADASERAQRSAERSPVVDPGDGPPLENLEAIYEQQKRQERRR